MVKKQYAAVRKKIIPAYTEYFKYSGVNGDIVGELNIDDNGNVSGFSDANYLEAPYPFGIADDYMEWVVGFTLTKLGISNQALIDGPAIAGRNMRLTINSSNKLYWRISTSNAPESYAYSITGSTTLALNTPYVVRCSYSSSTGYKMELSTDEGVSFTQIASNSGTTRPYAMGSTYVFGDNITTGSYLEGSINSKQTVFSNQDGVVFELAKYDAPATEEDYERKTEHPEETKVKEYTFYRRTGGYNRRFFIERVKESFNNSNMEIE